MTTKSIAHAAKRGTLGRWTRRLITLGSSVSGFAILSLSSVDGCLSRTVTVANQGGSGGTSGVTVDGANGVTTTSIASNGSGPSTATALALKAADFPAGVQPCGPFGDCPTAGPDLLFLEIASLGNTCPTPHGPDATSGMSWWMEIGLPDAYQAVGTYPLNDSMLYVGFSESVFQPMTATAQSGGGPGASTGAIQIEAIDATSVTFRLTGTNPAFAIDGDYVAKRCDAGI